jgi:phospholipase/carboxylesterase
MADACWRRPVPRRWLLAVGAAVLLGEGCAGRDAADRSRASLSGRGGGAAASQGRLSARPQASASGRVRRGIHPLGIGRGRDGEFYLPTAYDPARPAPLVLWLHGAGSSARVGAVLRRFAERAGLLVVAPDSRGRTWDAVLGSWGPDLTFIDQALAQVFGRCAVDPARVAVAGFSDGASYALSLALANGDLFTSALAFSPGFVPGAPRYGRPRLFVSHGTHDTVLPIDRTSRRIVPSLRRTGYDVRYREFDGGHTIPAQIEGEALAWMAGPRVG